MSPVPVLTKEYNDQQLSIIQASMQMGSSSVAPGDIWRTTKEVNRLMSVSIQDGASLLLRRQVRLYVYAKKGNRKIMPLESTSVRCFSISGMFLIVVIFERLFDRSMETVRVIDHHLMTGLRYDEKSGGF